MLHTGEYDPDLPLTFCRRQWALVGRGFQPFEKLWTFRSQEGCVTLDDYKDWVLDWPADSTVTFPRLLFGRAEVEKLKLQLDRLPDGKSFRQYLYVKETDKGREELWNKLGDNVTVEDSMTITAVGPLPPGQDSMVVLYPQSAQESSPRYEWPFQFFCRHSQSRGSAPV